MERLAAQGMKFTNAYSCPLCSPGRTSLMTGKTSARHRVTNWTAVDAPTLNEYSGGFPTSVLPSGTWPG